MTKLTEELILQIHDDQIRKHGGHFGIRDTSLFKSECVMPYQTFLGNELFPDVYDKAVRYLFGFATNQVFYDGNKRTASMVTLVYLELNDIKLDVDELSLYGVTMIAANHEISENEVKLYLIEHTI